MRTIEIADVADQPRAVRLGFAGREAIKAGVNLTGAYFAGAIRRMV